MPPHWAIDPTSWRTTPRPVGWKATRQAVLQRDGQRCVLLVSGQRCNAPANQVDHIGDPEDHSMGNLRSLCEPHHKARSARQGAAARWAKARAAKTKPHPGLLP